MKQSIDNTSFEGEKIDQTLYRISFFLIGVTGLTILAIFFCFTNWSSFANASKVAATFISIGSANLLGGAIVGFLFGIPRSGTPGLDNSSWYGDNTNLEEISDWLTKIIIGLTLIQFKEILRFLKLSAASIARSLSENIQFSKNSIPSSEFFYPWAYSYTIFFIAAGFAIGYLWTRINFALILTVTKGRLSQLSKIKQEKEQLQKDVNVNKAELEKIKDEVISVASHEDIRKAEATTVVSDLSQFTEDTREKLIQMIEASKGKQPVVPDDIQKGRWGGKDVNNGKKLSAEVTDRKGSGYYNVSIKVSSVIRGVSIESPVILFVHDSFRFPDNVILVKTDENGEAKADLPAYEAFTVGALCLDGTELELDLNEVVGYPTGFYWK